MEGSVSERPTMQQAFAADLAPVTESLPVSTPTPETTPAVPASAAAIGPPATSDPASVNPSTEPTGPIPFDRHKTILDGAYKERDEAKQQLEAWKPYEWAKQVDQTALNKAVELGQLYEKDRAGYIKQLLAEARVDPELGPIVRSELARELGSRPKSGPDLSDLTPDIPVHDQTGALVAQTYSADRVQAIVQRAVASAIAEHVQPLKQDADTRRQTEQQAEQQRQQTAFLTRESTRIKSAVQKLPHAMEHWPAIVEKARTYPEDLPVGEAVRDAYFEVVGPKLSQAAQATVLDTLKTKAAASSVNPAGAVVASAHKPKSMLDPSLKWS